VGIAVPCIAVVIALSYTGFMSSWVLLLAAAGFFAVLAIVLHVIMLSRYPEERARLSRRGRVARVKPTVEAKAEEVKIRPVGVKLEKTRPVTVKPIKARQGLIERLLRTLPIRPAAPARESEPLLVEPAPSDVAAAESAPEVAPRHAPAEPASVTPVAAHAATPYASPAEPATTAAPQGLANQATPEIPEPAPKPEPPPVAVQALLVEAEALLTPPPEPQPEPEPESVPEPEPHGPPQPEVSPDLIPADLTIAALNGGPPPAASSLDPLAAAVAALPAAPRPSTPSPAPPDPSRAARRLLAAHGPAGTDPDPGRLVFDAAEITRGNAELAAMIAAELARHAAEPAWRRAGLDFDQRLAEGQTPIILGGVLDRLVAALGDEDPHIASRAGHVADDILAVGGLVEQRARRALLTALAGAAVRHRPLPGGVVALAATLDRLEEAPGTS
jgi:hypothetical protein